MSDENFTPFESTSRRLQIGDGLIYYPGTEKVSCNRCGKESSIWQSVRVQWTAVCWECLSNHEKGSIVRQPGTMLSIVPAHMVFDNYPEEEKENDDDEEPEEGGGGEET